MAASESSGVRDSPKRVMGHLRHSRPRRVQDGASAVKVLRRPDQALAPFLPDLRALQLFAEHQCFDEILVLGVIVIRVRLQAGADPDVGQVVDREFLAVGAAMPSSPYAQSIEPPSTGYNSSMIEP